MQPLPLDSLPQGVVASVLRRRSVAPLRGRWAIKARGTRFCKLTVPPANVWRLPRHFEEATAVANAYDTQRATVRDASSQPIHCRLQDPTNGGLRICREREWSPNHIASVCCDYLPWALSFLKVYGNDLRTTLHRYAVTIFRGLCHF